MGHVARIEYSACCCKADQPKKLETSALKNIVQRLDGFHTFYALARSSSFCVSEEMIVLQLVYGRLYTSVSPQVLRTM